MRHSVVRFLLVGGLSFAIDMAALWALHGLLGMWLPLATALAYLAAFVINFGFSRHWAFAGQGAGEGGLGRQLRRYFLLVAANLALNVVGVEVLTWLGLPYLISKVVTSGALVVINYLVSRHWIFLRAAATEPDEAAPDKAEPDKAEPAAVS